MTESFFNGRVTLHAGDCLAVLPTLPENSIDSCVTDPPYHLQSITKRFAKTGRTDSTRTTSGPHQRTANGFMNKQWDGGDIAYRVETWAAVLRVLKPGAYCAAFGSTRGGHNMACAMEQAGFIMHPFIAWVFAAGFPKATRVQSDEWEGWRYGTQSLKPAIEPIYVGQKPFSEKTGTANVLRWGTGAVNVDGCRVGTESTKRENHGGTGDPSQWRTGNGGDFVSGSDLGRWPANLCHDGSDEVIEAFPETVSSKAGWRNNNNQGHEGWSGTIRSGPLYSGHSDSGSAARFFYSAKASRSERAGSSHPTVKPIALMQWLCRLITPPKVIEFVCISCNNTRHDDARLQAVRPAVSEQAQDSKILFEDVPSRELHSPAYGLSSVREDDGDSRARSLLERVSLDSTTEAEDASAERMRALRSDVPTEEKRGAPILQPQMRRASNGAGEAQADQDCSRLHLPIGSRKSDGDEAGLRDGASPYYGEALGPAIAGGGSRPSRQRDTPRQPDREPASHAQGGARQTSETDHIVSDPVPLLQGDAEIVKYCPKCAGRLIRTERPGLVLDPFAGTGTTAEAAYREGFNAVLIEREPEYQADIRRRMAMILAGPDERKRESTKARGKTDHAGPLFGDAP